MNSMPERLHRPVLVLNASYEPINICAARRALVLVALALERIATVLAGSIPSARPSPCRA